jgi:hypothetical protein
LEEASEELDNTAQESIKKKRNMWE